MLLALGLRLAYMFEPYSGLEHDFLSHFGAYTTGVHARNFLEHGIGASHGMPYFWRVELADGTWEHQHYLHHPAGIVWVHTAGLWLFGATPFGMRMPSLLFSLASCWSVFLFARRLFGRGVGLLALLFMAVLPYSVHFATQAWSDAAHVATGTAMLLFTDRWLSDRRRRDLVAACLCMAAGGLLDWPANFWLPPLAVMLLVRMRAEGGFLRVLPLVALPLTAIATIGLHWMHMQAVAGAEAATGDTAHTLDRVVGFSVPLGQFALDQLRHAVAHLGWPAAVWIVVGAALCLAPRFSGMTVFACSPRAFGLLWVAALPGLEYVLAFPGRSTNHIFFPMLSLPFFAIAAGLATSWAWRRAANAPARALTAAIALACVGGALERDYRLWSESRSPQIEILRTTPEIAAWIDDPDAVLLTHLGRGMALCFYSRAQIIHSVNTPAELAGRQALLRRLAPDRRAAFLADLRYLKLIDPTGELRTALQALGELRVIETEAGLFALIELKTGE